MAQVTIGQTPLSQIFRSRLENAQEDPINVKFFHFTGNESGCGIKCAAVVVSDDFKGKSRVKR